MRVFLLLLLVIATLLWFWGLRSSATLFTVVVKNGRIVRSKGRIPPRLLADLKDVIENAHVSEARIRAVTRDGEAVLQFNGEMSPGAQQQARNVMGQFSTGQIRNAKKH